MTERIKKLAELTLSGAAYVRSEELEFDRRDLFLPTVTRDAKRAKEYILHQTPFLCAHSALTGYLSFHSQCVMGDIFVRCGHPHWREAKHAFYCKPLDGFATFEWQHSSGDFAKVIRQGIRGYRAEIAASRERHTDEEARTFLNALDVIADAVVAWAHKCAALAEAEARQADDLADRARLSRLSAALLRVPENPAETFFEAVLSLYLTFSFVPDSIGCIDRYLYPYYEKDLREGRLSRAEAGELLQELFLMLQAKTKPTSANFTRGGESHFCIGGTLPDGSDGFNDLSRLIVESLMDLPTWAPEISLRYTEKTPHEVFRYLMDCERRDPYKRIAFVNDAPRLRAFRELTDIPFPVACNYTMVGCNEPQLPGGIFMGGCTCNVVKAVERCLTARAADVCAAADFDAFFGIFREALTETLGDMVHIYNEFQRLRAEDVNVVSSMFFEGSIERATSITQGGAAYALADITVIGLTTVIDSLAVIRQFVYDERRVDMKTLLAALRADWAGYEDLRREILSRGHFFGNGYADTADCVDRFAGVLTEYFKGKKSELGYPFVLGNLIGYNQHNVWFGAETAATPDGRHAGDRISFGIGQSEGKDRAGLTALFADVAHMNAYPVLAGDTVTNVLLDEKLMRDENFEKTVLLLETYFKIGGLHFQLCYVSKDDLKAAKITPEEYRNLRVRVSGFSEYFVLLNDDLQDEIIARTEKNG